MNKTTINLKLTKPETPTEESQHNNTMNTLEGTRTYLQNFDDTAEVATTPRRLSSAERTSIIDFLLPYRVDGLMLRSDGEHRNPIEACGERFEVSPGIIRSVWEQYNDAALQTPGSNGDGNHSDDDNNLPTPRKLSKNLSNNERAAVVHFFLLRQLEGGNGKLVRGALKSCALEFKCHTRTCKRIWDRYLQTKSPECPAGRVSSMRINSVGEKGNH